ncbi:putative nicotinamide mononucleotide adenylyltransferase [Clavulina sp. PMI_390]|nr:putative nicotinamide mononucleotide adenylyltransferase [Clavulina sp. PMI_390]
MDASVTSAYALPTHRIRRLRDAKKTPVILVACGSFSPITYAHMRMFEMANDYCRQNTNFEVVGGYMSPVGDKYKKPGLLSSSRRLACDQDSAWLMVDDWEASQPEYQRTAVVLQHFDQEINQVLGGVEDADGVKHRVRVVLLAGSDLIQTMSEPGVWSMKDLEVILGRFGTFIIERAGSDVDEALDNLSIWRENIFVVRQMIHNDVSSTKIRLFLRRGMSVHYLLPNAVIRYIEQHHLYVDDHKDLALPPAENAAAAGPSASTSTVGA